MIAMTTMTTMVTNAKAMTMTYETIMANATKKTTIAMTTML
jgi:hypothetical protein